MTDTERDWRGHWQGVSRRWEARLADMGLDGLIPALKPLGPAAAHLLWMAGPLLGPADGGAVGGLAEFLYAPDDPAEREAGNDDR